MPIASSGLARILRSIAATVAVIVAVSLPLGYWLVVYGFAAEAASIDATAHANLVSERISADPDLWQFEVPRLDVIAATHIFDQDLPERHYILDERGAVLAQSMENIPPPALTRSVPLFDADSVVGQVVTVRSLLPLLQRTALVAAFGLLLALAVYVSLSVLPLRAIARLLGTLDQERKRLRTIVDNAVEGIITFNRQGILQSLNPAAVRMFDYSEAEAVGRSAGELLPEIAMTGYGQADAGAELGTLETVGRRRDGSSFPIEFAVGQATEGGERQFIAIARDITERKRADQQIQRSQRELRELSKAANEALEAERRRTARELHDELGQSLTALKMDIESLQTDLSPYAPDLGQRAQAMRTMLDGTIAATRRIAANLRPLMLDDLGLAAALDWLTHNFSNHTGIATDLVVDDAVAQVPEPIASALYRITQESLTNVAKYAQATTAEIRLEQDGDWVRLTVRDNGRGIVEADQSKRGAFGLLGIRERVTLLSGEVTIGGAPGQGSEVCARIPLAAAAEQE